MSVWSVWSVVLLGLTAVVTARPAAAGPEAAGVTDVADSARVTDAAGVAGPAGRTDVAAQVATEYRNPVVNGWTASPSIVWSEPDQRYHAYFSGLTFLGLNVPAYSSPDLVTWQQHLNVLPSAQAGAWVDASDGRLFTSPAVGHFPDNPAASRWVLYFIGVQASTGDRCIGVATASTPTGPFTGPRHP